MRVAGLSTCMAGPSPFPSTIVWQSAHLSAATTSGAALTSAILVDNSLLHNLVLQYCVEAQVRNTRTSIPIPFRGPSAPLTSDEHR